MSESMPSLNSLRAFEAAARHLSFSKAAEELNVTPAAVSQQVKTLEENLEMPVFHRLNRGLALTDVGLAGVPKLQKAFCMLTRGVECMRGAEEADLLAVEAAPSFAAKWLIPRLPRFSAQHPDIDLRIAGSLDQIDGSTAPVGVRDSFRNGGANVGVRFGRGKYPGCQVDRLISVVVVPLCSPQLIQGKHPLLTPRDLNSHTLLHDDTPWEGRPNWGQWASAFGFSDLSLSRGPHFNSVHLVLQAAMEGQGVALGIEALAADDIAAGRLVVPFDCRLPMASAYYLVTLGEIAESTRYAAFRAWILREARAFQARSEASYSHDRTNSNVTE